MALTRNKYCVPHLEKEGLFLKPIVAENISAKEESMWKVGLKPFQRMHSHQTLASARRFAHFKPFSGLIPKDTLDFILTSPYDQSTELFAERLDIYLQPETLGIETWRRLKNSRQKRAKRDPFANVAVEAIGGFEILKTANTGERDYPYRYNENHPVLLSGVTDKRHPCNMKLMLSSHHSPQTNAGYSRQDSDGTVFQY